MSMLQDEEGHQRPSAMVTSAVKAGELPTLDTEMTPDEEALYALGYKQEFR